MIVHPPASNKTHTHAHFTLGVEASCGSERAASVDGPTLRASTPWRQGGRPPAPPPPAPRDCVPPGARLVYSRQICAPRLVCFVFCNPRSPPMNSAWFPSVKSLSRRTKSCLVSRTPPPEFSHPPVRARMYIRIYFFSLFFSFFFSLFFHFFFFFFSVSSRTNANLRRRA